MSSTSRAVITEWEGEAETFAEEWSFGNAVIEHLQAAGKKRWRPANPTKGSQALFRPLEMAPPAPCRFQRKWSAEPTGRIRVQRPLKFWPVDQSARDKVLYTERRVGILRALSTRMVPGERISQTQSGGTEIQFSFGTPGNRSFLQPEKSGTRR